jgi:hypothetical protein
MIPLWRLLVESSASLGLTGEGAVLGIGTLNLSAKAILFGHDADAFERRILGAEPLTEAEHLIWHKKGPAGKLHNLVVAIHRSDLLAGMLRNIQQEAFNKSCDPKLNARKPLDVILDNDTRWL